MEKKYPIFIVIYVCMIISSCVNRQSETTPIDSDINRVISSCDSISLNSINLAGIDNILIGERSRTLTEIVYTVGNSESRKNTVVYFVTFDLIRQTITSVKTIEPQQQEYLTYNQITNAIEGLRKYDLYCLDIESDNYIYIKPFYPFSLIKAKFSIRDSIIKRYGYEYKLYKGNWYIHK